MKSEWDLSPQVFNLFYLDIYISYWKRNLCLHIKISNIFGLKLFKTNMSSFRPLEVVGCGSKTQLQVGENLNYLIYRFKG